MNELVSIEGTVVDYTPITKAPGKPYKVSFITVECPVVSGTPKPEYAYYTFKCFKESQLRKVFRNARITCTVKRESWIWTVDGHWKMKDKTMGTGSEKVTMGRVPIIMEDYRLVGEIYCELPEAPGPLGLDNTGDDGLPF